MGTFKIGIILLSMLAVSNCNPEMNKEIVKEMLQKVFVEKMFDDATLEKYFGDKYIEHNPGFSDGRENLKMLEPLVDGIEIKRMVAEGDLVWVHYRFLNKAEPGKSMAAVDILRLEDGKVVEHWDVIQDVPEPGMSKNDHPMF